MSRQGAIIQAGDFCFSTLVGFAQDGATEDLKDAFQHLKTLGADSGLCPQTMAENVVEKALAYDIGAIAKIVDPVVGQTNLGYSRAP